MERIAQTDRVLIRSSPVGMLTLVSSGRALTHLLFGERFPATKPDDILLNVSVQLDEYFSGDRKTFDVPLEMAGTDFQKACWEALRTIPYGETCTYSDIARRIGRPKACRAVGQANHVNPVSIIVPCHRVIGSGGSLTGYGGGMDAKRLLLQLEGVKICK